VPTSLSSTIHEATKWAITTAILETNYQSVSTQEQKNIIKIIAVGNLIDNIH
jgi:hypothetical protein